RIEISSAVEADRVTAVALDHVASFEPLPSWRVAGGNQQLALSLAARLGDRVRLGEVVRAVEQQGAEVVVRTDGGEATFDAVIVALPLSIVKDGSTIALPLTDEKRAALDRVLQGHAAKLHIPLRSVPGTSAVMSVPGRFWNWTAVDATGEVAPVLNGFMGSLSGIERMGALESPDAWVAASKEVRRELDYLDADPMVTVWTKDPLARGAYAAHSPDLRASDHLTLESPVGAVHYAGEYCEAEYTG